MGSGGNPGGHFAANDDTIDGYNYWFFDTPEHISNDIVVTNSASEEIYYKFGNSPGADWTSFEVFLSSDDTWLNADGRAESAGKIEPVLSDIK